jgi:hypothetical protein
LLGPGESEEIIEDAPITKYVTGVLYPSGAGVLDPEQDVDEDDAEDRGDEVATDPPIALANVRYPSSMGLTFAVDPDTSTTIGVRVTSARYVPIVADTDESQEARSRRWRRAEELAPPSSWRRVPIDVPQVDIDVTSPKTHTSELVPGLELFWRVRSPDLSNRVPITLALVNRLSSPPGELRDTESFFQPRIEVSASGTAAFVERPTIAPPKSDDDLRSYQLLYRHSRAFAVGHGCSVEWESAADGQRAIRLATTYVPSHALLLADSNPAIPLDGLGMRFQAEASDDEIIGALRRLTGGYADWVAQQRAESANLAEDLATIAARHLDTCDLALRRMNRGIELLGDPEVLRAYRLANEAMLRQRAQAAWVRAGRPDEGPVRDDSHVWRPFQLAFILLCIEGIAVPGSADREIADLLWFPTGGGKTEAYLGLIAFTVLLRRLRRPDAGGGVTVIMRYTLRLLTIQQFERASILICALEQIRRTSQDLGSDEISVGLWVGQGATPNDLQGARRALDKIRQGRELDEGNPIQVHACSWCGHPMDHRNYYVRDDRTRLVITCRQESCAFSNALPVYVVDEDIYRHRPSLIIATADKFASLPWREEAANLFNLNPPRLSPPELIIQDELHLISGPLGTLAGLYETAIDLTCSRSGTRPKVVASTATIRRAAQQSLSLFDRVVHQFPPSGLDARDSYFAVEAPAASKGSRLYVGLMAPGTSQTTLLVRTYAALLQFAKELPGSDEIRDAFWTLIGYFNSLRVLGGARMQVQDDVRDRLQLLAAQSGSTPRELEPSIELTSREPSADIPTRLKQMALGYPDPNALVTILATNMISVGVDIDRLGLMAVMGQPQSTSEYIQATSRVGRTGPGLVVTMFNSARSRDRSHYESFVSYHSALYRQVESTSATPFSPRARDRGLHAVLVALARLLLPGARRNTAAADLERFRAGVEQLREEILERVQRVAPAEVVATRREIDEIIATWAQRVADVPALVYRNRDHPDRALLVDADRDDIDDTELMPTMWSLRDVDRSSNLYLVR